MMDKSHHGMRHKRALEKQVLERSEDEMDEEIEQKRIKLDNSPGLGRLATSMQAVKSERTDGLVLV